MVFLVNLKVKIENFTVMKHMRYFQFLLTGLLLQGILSCSASSDTTETITMVGYSELALDSISDTAVTINFTGKKTEKSLFITLLKSGALAQFEPTLQFENMYLEGESSPREFTYSLSYLLILKDKTSMDVIVQALEKDGISAYVSTAGTFIATSDREDLLERLFDKALANAVQRVKKYADAQSKDFTITAVADADDTFGPVIPMDGIAYQSKLSKRVQVTASLH